MKRVILPLLGFAVLTAFVPANELCDTLKFFKEGSQSTVVSFDDNGKEIGKTIRLFKKVTATTEGADVTVAQETFDKKGKSNGVNEYLMHCKGNVILMDMKMFMPQQQMEAFKDMEITMEGSDLEIPAAMTVGSALKDFSVLMKMTPKGSSPMPAMKMEIKNTNRKVEAEESITVGAGTYKCFKITEDVEVKSMMKMKMKTATWFNYEVGMVKTETYKENGKLMDRSELAEFK